MRSLLPDLLIVEGRIILRRPPAAQRRPTLILSTSSVHADIWYYLDVSWVQWGEEERGGYQGA